MAAAEGPALSQQQPTDLQGEILVPVGLAENFIPRQAGSLAIGQPAPICQMQRGKPDSEKRGSGRHISKGTHS
jgi:hypothetical protein